MKEEMTWYDKGLFAPAHLSLLKLHLIYQWNFRDKHLPKKNSEIPYRDSEYLRRKLWLSKSKCLYKKQKQKKKKNNKKKKTTNKHKQNNNKK